MKKFALALSIFLLLTLFIPNNVQAIGVVANYPVGDAYTVFAIKNSNRGHESSLVLSKEAEFSPRSGSWINDIYLVFQLSGLPKMAKIYKATLKMYQYNVRVSQSASVNILRLKGHWDEANLTYNIAPKSIFADPYAPQYVISGSPIQEWDVTRMVQDWVDGADNFGMVIKLTEDTVDWYSEFYSKDSSSKAKFPQLIISYDSPDLSALSITNIKAERVDSTTAQVTWDTNRSSSTDIKYWEEKNPKAVYTGGVASDRAIHHRALMQNLKPGMTYKYQVSSACEFGNIDYWQTCNSSKRREEVASNIFTLTSLASLPKIILPSPSPTKILQKLPKTAPSPAPKVDNGIINKIGSLFKKPPTPTPGQNNDSSSPLSTENPTESPTENQNLEPKPVSESEKRYEGSSAGVPVQAIQQNGGIADQIILELALAIRNLGNILGEFRQSLFPGLK